MMFYNVENIEIIIDHHEMRIRQRKLRIVLNGLFEPGHGGLKVTFLAAIKMTLSLQEGLVRFHTLSRPLFYSSQFFRSDNNFDLPHDIAGNLLLQGKDVRRLPPILARPQ